MKLEIGKTYKIKDQIGSILSVQLYKIESFLWQKSYIIHIQGNFPGIRTLRFKHLPSLDDVLHKYIKFYIIKKIWTE